MSLSAWFAPYRHPRVAAMLVLGFSAGLPFPLVFGTLSFWLSEAGIDRATIGHLAWVGLAYGGKFLWAPLIDRVRLPGFGRLGRRRGWLLASQLAIAASLVGLARSDPRTSLAVTVGFALSTAFASATQDIALDAWRIEAVSLARQGAMAAAYQTGYRAAMLVAGAGALGLAAAVDPSPAYEAYPWAVAYLAMAVLMILGIATTLVIAEPLHDDTAWAAAEKLSSGSRVRALTAWFAASVVAPFVEFFRRYRWQALGLLLLIALYRISDVVMGVMSNPFYQEMGFSKGEVATVSKVYGVLMTLLGAGFGGILVARVGIRPTLLVGALLSSMTNLLFVWLAGRGHDVGALVLTVSADNLAAGVASAAFVAFLSSLVNQAYTATQYALFTSVMALLPKFVAGLSGDMVNAWGWAGFFTSTALLGVPVILLIVLVRESRGHE